MFTVVFIIYYKIVPNQTW